MNHKKNPELLVVGAINPPRKKRRLRRVILKIRYRARLFTKGELSKKFRKIGELKAMRTWRRAKKIRVRHGKKA